MVEKDGDGFELNQTQNYGLTPYLSNSPMSGRRLPFPLSGTGRRSARPALPALRRRDPCSRRHHFPLADESESAARPDQRQPLRRVDVLLDNIRSLYNVGSIFRTADGAGIRHLYLCGITPTPDNPKLAKTSLGAEQTVGWSYHANAVDLIDRETGGLSCLGAGGDDGCCFALRPAAGARRCRHPTGRRQRGDRRRSGHSCPLRRQSRHSHARSQAVAQCGDGVWGGGVRGCGVVGLWGRLAYGSLVELSELAGCQRRF